MTKEENFRQDILYYGAQFLGTPYRWGGKRPETGFDCSGFVQHVLKHFQLIPIKVMSSGMMCRWYRDNGLICRPRKRFTPQPGDILFFGKILTKNIRVRHCSFSLNNEHRILDCGRGGKNTSNLITTLEHRRSDMDAYDFYPVVRGVCVRKMNELHFYDLLGIVNIWEAHNALK